MIETEFSKWKKASNGNAKMPPVINFSAAESSFHYPEAAGIGKNFVNAAISQPDYGGSLLFPEMTPEIIAKLRHELTHTNDLKQGKNIPAQYNLDEIIPNKELLINGKLIKQLPEIEECKYANEFKKAGIPDKLITYAHTNTKEFIAVAAQGNLNKYSPKFKEMLIDFGMPEWMFKLETDN